jgi:hypothetical protein
MLGLFAARRTPTKMYLILPIPFIVLGLFVVNYFVPIFPFTVGTNNSLLIYIVPYLLIVYPLLVGFSLVLDSGSRYRTFLLALFLAPITIVVFGFLFGLNPTLSYPMIVRTYDFIDIGVAVAVGVGIAAMIKKLKSKNARAALGVLFVVTCFATTSIAYNTQKVFNIQNTTYEYEIDAIKWIKEKNTNGMNISTDRRVWEIAHRVYDLNGDYVLPITMQSQKLTKNSICIIESQWTRPPGAQLWPLDSVVVPKTDMERHFIPDNNIVTVTGPDDNIIYVMVRP